MCVCVCGCGCVCVHVRVRDFGEAGGGHAVAGETVTSVAAARTSNPDRRRRDAVSHATHRLRCSDVQINRDPPQQEIETLLLHAQKMPQTPLYKENSLQQ